MDEETTLNGLEVVEQIIIDFGNICRFCLSETKNNVSVHDTYSIEYSNENDEITISDFVKRITSIEMEDIEGFPALVCENCFANIKICLEFRQSCRQSEFTLKTCYEKTLEEAKAKFSFNSGNDVQVHSRSGEDEDQSDGTFASVEHNSENIEVYVNNDKVEEKDCNNGDDDNVKADEGSLKPPQLTMSKKSSLFKKDSLSVLKAGTIKQKYQRISSLSERLKEAQSKLVEDILRTKDIISTSFKSEGKESSSNERVRFSCPQCQKSFVISEMLTFHFITSHIADRKMQRMHHIFQCDICKKEFSYMYQLMRHYKNMHKIPMSKLSPEHLAPKNKNNTTENTKNYQCLDCQPPKVFNKKKNFLRHLMEHSNLEDSFKNVKNGKLYTCMRCDTNQTFATKFSLNRHLMNIHKVNRNELSRVMSHVIDSNTEVKEELPEKENVPVPISKESWKHEGNTMAIKLLKIFVCLDCSPPASFTEVAPFVEHKSELHEKKLESMSLKELTPVYVESVNVFQEGIEGCQTFKVICKSCEKPAEFSSASDFVQHMNEFHGNVPNEKWDVETKFLLNPLTVPKRRDRIWKCTECPASYIRKHSLHYHLKEKHNKLQRIGGVKCPEPECKASFFTNRQVIQHGITVHEKYFANLHKVFKDKILRSSPEADERTRNFECDICQKKYLGKTSLKRHILRTHLGKLEMENAICPYCGKTFSNNLNLKSHIDFVHEAVFVSCPVCKKSINFKTIGKHYKVHQANTEFHLDAKNRFLCNQCGRVLKSKSGFDDHQKLHLNVRDQICDICGNGFTTKKNLYIHKKAHDLTQKKLFKCDQCEKAFTGKHTLNRHLLTHSGEKNFICEMCSKCFYTLQELNRHVRYHKKEYRFDCQLCDMRFLDRSRFRHHMMRHRNIRPHKCHFCDKVFIVRRKLNLHMAARHNVEVQNTKSVWKDPKTYIPLDDLL